MCLYFVCKVGLKELCSKAMQSCFFLLYWFEFLIMFPFGRERHCEAL